MNLIVKNVRSLCGLHCIPIRPLTVLVGENSTGKTTFLATLAHISQPGFPSLQPSFNFPPFDLGTYDSIATFKGGRYGRADSFSVGFEDTERQHTRRLVATYISSMGQAHLSRLEIERAATKLVVEVEEGLEKGRFTITLPDGKIKKHAVPLQQIAHVSQGMLPLLYFLRLIVSESTRKKEERLEPLLETAFRWSIEGIGPVLALAPVRTKPRRTYDEISEEFKPEGDHIPVLLARIWQEEGSTRRESLVAALEEFGASSSLFESIGVKRLGKRPSDPFQIRVSMAGPAANLPDVGYGVSQALPVVVQSVLAEKGRTLLLQQPEVHLHPRGQAALGSFFCRLVAAEKKRFVIETHSDYLLDRIRVEVARGTLPATDVLILFFEKREIETSIHQIHLDKNGNVLNAPSSYRRFFMEEEDSLMSRVG